MQVITIDHSIKETDTLRVSLHPFHLDDLLNQLEHTCQSKAHAKKLQLNIENTLGISHKVISDRTHLEQLLSHLLHHAIEQTQQGTVSLKITAKQQGHTLIMTEFNVMGASMAQAPATITLQLSNAALQRSSHLVQLLDGELTYQGHQDGRFCFHFIIPLAVEADDFKHLHPISQRVAEPIHTQNELLNPERLAIFEIEDIKVIIDLFSRQLPNTLKLIHDACQHNNLSALYHQIHKLKSSAATLGAEALAHFCQQIESTNQLIPPCLPPQLAALDLLAEKTMTALTLFVEQQQTPL